MNVIEAAREVGVNERTLRRALADGRLTGTKNNGVWDIDPDDARRAVRDRTGGALYQEALAEALQLLREVNHAAHAEDLERRYGLEYIEPKPRVRSANSHPRTEPTP